MSSTSRQIAEAVRDLLNQGSFKEAFSAELRYLPPSLDQQVIGSLNVLVVPGPRSTQIESRSEQRRTVNVDIGVLKRITPDDIDEADALLNLVESFGDYLAQDQNRSFSVTAGRVAWQGQEQDPLYYEEHLDNHNAFVTVLRITYRLL